MRINAIAPQNHPIKFNKTNKSQTNNSQYSTNSLMNFDIANSFKNQIMFKGSEANPIPLDLIRGYKLHELQKNLGTYIQDTELLHQAFVHHSMLDAIDIPPIKYDYRRLAHLGDNALKASIAKLIYEEKDDIEPSKMIEISRNLLSENNLIELSKEMGLDEFLLIDENYLRGRTPKKPYADIFRSYIGAIVANDKECGLDDAHKFISKVFKSEIQQQVGNIGENAKNQLRNYVEHKGLDASKIRYQATMKDNGYAVRVYYDRKFLATAFKDYKEQAEESAALNALRDLNNGFVKI